jgi:lipopolysaccharide/colanic/teichoic acid biosynthesis glycosyltransferase
MQRLGLIGTSPSHSTSEDVDSSVLSSSVPADAASPLDLATIEDAAVDHADLMIEVDEIRLRRLIDADLDGTDGGIAAVEPAAPGTEAAAVVAPAPAAISDERPVEPAPARQERGPVPASVRSRYLKRAIDVIGSVAALAALSPVLVTCAAIVRRGSHGPIFFRQQRIGQDGRAFTMLKLRTMYVDADSAVHEAYVKRYIAGAVGDDAADGARVFKLVGDARITPAGRWLRRLSIDELPQLINVLRGDMSLVGPRPPLPYEVEHYQPRDLERLRAKPGITGLWQVSGRNSTTFNEMIDLDLRYITRWSVWLDLWILWRTIPVVLFPDGH